MQTIKRRLNILFVTSSIAAILLVTLFVNITISNRFNHYMSDNQNKRYERIVSYFEEIYKRENKWSENSGIELMHEAYMGNYCLTLLDRNQKYIWTMDPDNIKSNIIKTMPRNEGGIYNSNRFEIKVDGNIVGYVDIGQYYPILLSQEDMNFKKSINESIVLSGTITLIIFICLSLYISRQFSIPIKAVENMAIKLSRGVFNIKSSTKSNIEELENLRKSINILGEKLKYQDELRRRLVSDISHEIRTPLNVLQNNLEAMIDGIFPITIERLNYLNEEVIRFGELLNSLDILKEFETEIIKTNFDSISLDKLIKGIYEDFYIETENKNIRFYYNIELEKSYSIKGDKDKLKQVFINLISNSIKFTEEYGEIITNLYTKDENIIVEIKDNGIGIKKEDLPFVFERFYRGDKSRNQFEGSGVGLTISKNILDSHNADISVESEEGKGTIFKISFKEILGCNNS